MKNALYEEKVHGLLNQWQPIFDLDSQGGISMFVPDMPPEIPWLDTPVMIAEAVPAEQMQRKIGVCTLVEPVWGGGDYSSK